MQCGAVLRVCSDEDDVDFITQALGLDPTRSFLKGTPVSWRFPDKLRPVSLWLFDPALDRSRRLEDHLEKVLEVLEHRTSGVQALIRRGCSLEILCSVSSESGQANSDLSASLLRRLADQPIDVLLSLYPPETSSDESDPTAR